MDDVVVLVATIVASSFVATLGIAHLMGRSTPPPSGIERSRMILEAKLDELNGEELQQIHALCERLLDERDTSAPVTLNEAVSVRR